MGDAAYQTTPDTLADEVVEQYRRDGFVHVPGIITKDEAEEFRQIALDLQARVRNLNAGANKAIFTQLVNVWQVDDGIKALTLHPNVGAVAERLAGIPLRLWHDHVLIKQPQNNASTEFHQDQPYWPHANCRHALSAWIALVDVPVERGCMTFLPRSHERTDLRAQNLADEHDLLQLAPEFVWYPRVTLPLKAGDCTFHHARTAHMATPNFTDDPRVAHIVIFMDAETTYTGARHVVSDDANLAPDSPFDHPLFPRVGG